MSARTRAKKVVAIDWDARTLRVVHALLPKRGVKIDRLLSAVIPSEVDPADPEQMGRYISRTLDQEGITTKHAVVDIPRDQTILKTLQLPVARPDELPGMVEIQIAKELPFPVTEAVIDFTAAPHAQGSATADVLVAAVRHEQLEQYEATCATAGLRLDRVGLRPYANKVAVCALLEHAMPQRVLSIDVRPTFMEIDILRDSVLAFSRSASVVIPKRFEESGVLSLARPDGGVPDRDALGAEAVQAVGSGTEQQEAPLRQEQVVRSLVLEVTRSIEAYRVGDPGATIDHVVIGGDVGVEEMLAEAIQKRLNLTTEMYNPARTFGWEPDEGAGAVAFAASLGLVLGHADHGTPQFDFLHPKRTISATRQTLLKGWMAAAVVGLFVTAIPVGLAGATRDSRRKLADLEKKIDEEKGQRSIRKKFLDLMVQIEAFDDAQYVWVDVLCDVFSVLPSNQDILLNHMEMNHKEGQLTLKTRAKERDTAGEVIRRLNEFRREGHDRPRLKASMGGQKEQKTDRYPFVQELRILILDDESEEMGKSGSRRAGG